MLNKPEIAEPLNTLLADYMVYYQKLRNYHWNVRGKRFFQLHEEFEKLYNQASLFADGIAERVSRLGTQPYSTLAAFVDNARLEEDPTPPGADEMVRNLLEDINSLNGWSAQVVELCEKKTDMATANLLEDIIEKQEENAWMLSAWLNE